MKNLREIKNHISPALKFITLAIAFFFTNQTFASNNYNVRCTADVVPPYYTNEPPAEKVMLTFDLVDGFLANQKMQNLKVSSTLSFFNGQAIGPIEKTVPRPPAQAMAPDFSDEAWYRINGGHTTDCVDRKLTTPFTCVDIHLPKDVSQNLVVDSITGKTMIKNRPYFPILVTQYGMGILHCEVKQF